jgi:hypothetical protein
LRRENVRHSSVGSRLLTVKRNGRAPEARVRLLFSDNVHMSDVGRSYMALVHYAVLLGRSPEGVAIRKPLPSEMGRNMQTLA